MIFSEDDKMFKKNSLEKKSFISNKIFLVEFFLCKKISLVNKTILVTTVTTVTIVTIVTTVTTV